MRSKYESFGLNNRYETCGINNEYEAFGLKIHSEIQLPELRPCESEIPDLTIQLGKVDPDSEPTLDEGFSFKTTKNAIYRFWDTIGKFKITKDSIVVDPVSGLNKTSFKKFSSGNSVCHVSTSKGIICTACKFN